MKELLTRFFNKFVDAGLSHFSVAAVLAVVSLFATIIGRFAGLPTYWIYFLAGAFVALTALMLLVAISALVRNIRGRLDAVLFWPLMVVTATVLVFFGFTGYELYSLRDDIDRYLMPRHLTERQASKVSDDLSHHDPQDIKIAVNKNDPEALQYYGEIVNALVQGGWNVTTTTYVDDAAIGLTMVVEQPGQPSKPDRKHPTPDAILGQAFKDANVIVNGGGDDYTKPTYALWLKIGHRPLILDPSIQQPAFPFIWVALRPR